ncbi:MAG TPA: SAM-dependent chlorinase/fluorinase [Candidatus Lokiarchaeia archaeon]
MRSIIALLTDFGSKGTHYIASMKAVILKVNPKAVIVDISHDISSYSIFEASFLIKSTYKVFPKNSVFIIVVDPGVGSSREILALKTRSEHFFVGPNNGIIPNALNLKEISECYVVQNKKYFNLPISYTFHGRDVMAPVGAYISKKIPLKNFGPQFNLKNLIEYPIIYEFLAKEKTIRCTIQYIDSFGNGITNILVENNVIQNTSLILDEFKNVNLQFKDKTYRCLLSTHYADVPLGSTLILKGSSDFLEISKNQGNAAEEMDFKVGDIITITFH